MEIFSKELWEKNKTYNYYSFISYSYTPSTENLVADKYDGKTKKEMIDDGYINFVEKYKNCFIKINKKEGKIIMEKENSEIKELKRDIEILLNIYMSNREMNKKEIKRFSERYYDIIEKQNAKNTLKRRGK